ncbi:MAG: hypothetical protein ACI9JN_001097 [Bacteroidia bacterium]|jgi:hypothetical protein
MQKVIRFGIYLGLFLLCPLSSVAASSIDFTTKCVSAQQFIYQLRLDEAKEILELEQTSNPKNVAIDYLMVVHGMLAYITNESNQTYFDFDSLKNIALDRVSDCPELNGNRDFLLEEIYFYASVVNGKRGNTIAAANDVRSCYKHGTKVIDQYPDFHAAKKTIGLLSSGFGSLPNTYRKLIQFFGYQSSVDHGLDLLDEFISTKDTRPEWTLMKKEAKFYVASIHLYLKNDKITAWNMVDGLTTDYPTNPLSGFARVNFADKCNRNNEIIKVVKAIPTTKPYEPIPFLTFMLGKAKLNRLDADADTYLLDYLNKYTGKSYVKSCYQKLSWYALINADSVQYNTYLMLASQKGNTALEEDEQANKYAYAGLTPNVELLKTRLLFDGGYYDKALDIIRPLKVKNFSTDLQKTVYFYRKGRVYDALLKNDLAEAFYLEAMSAGETLPQYYASYAALYLAELMERQDDFVKAKTYFKKAMSFGDNKEYKKSIEHRAKNGLDRIE